jgi:hypothetical protein
MLVKLNLLLIVHRSSLLLAFHLFSTRRYRRDECAAEKLRANLLLMESFVRDTPAALALQNSQMSAFAAARSAEKITAVPAAVTRRI